MSGVSFLEKLLDGTGVEWKVLGDTIKTVTAHSKLKREAYRNAGKMPIIDQGIDFIAGYTNDNVIPIKVGKYVVFGSHLHQFFCSHF